MKHYLHKTWNSLMNGLKPRDLVKFIPLALLALFFLRDDPNLPIFLVSIGLIMLFACASHVIRKIIFWGHSMDELYRNAKENPVAAAICYFGICYFLTGVFQSMMLYLK